MRKLGMGAPVECILLLSRIVKAAGFGWAAGVQGGIPGAEVASVLDPGAGAQKASSRPWRLAAKEAAEGASLSEQLCCVVSGAQP